MMDKGIRNFDVQPWPSVSKTCEWIDKSRFSRLIYVGLFVAIPAMVPAVALPVFWLLAK